MDLLPNDIFISYSRNDKKIIFPLVQQLKTAGFKVWIDSEGIYTGTKFKAAIVKAIEESQVFLFFSSQESNKSPWTAREIAIAIDRGKHIIPIKLDRSRYNPDIELNLINLDYIDYTKTKARPQEYEKLLRTLNRFCYYRSEEAKLAPNLSTDNEKTEYEQASFHPIINSAITFQLVIFVVFFLTFLWILVAPGCLAFYYNFQPSLLFLCAFMFLSIYATYKLKTHKSIWIGVFAASDFFIVFYLCTIAKYLYSNWFALSHQMSHLPTSIRYRLLYYLGRDMSNHNIWGMHSFLIILAFCHIILICILLFIKNNGKSGWQIMK